jgi:hypothetical protein
VNWFWRWVAKKTAPHIGPRYALSIINSVLQREGEGPAIECLDDGRLIIYGNIIEELPKT